MICLNEDGLLISNSTSVVVWHRKELGEVFT
jgi:hypothetical protein